MTNPPTADRPRAATSSVPVYERGAFSFYLRTDIIDEVDNYIGQRARAGDTRLRRSHVVEDAVLAYLDELVFSETED